MLIIYICKKFFHNYFFGCVWVLLPAAFFPLWTILTVLTAVPCSGNGCAVLYLCGNFSAVQFSPLGADKAVFLFVILHILDSANLGPVLLSLLCFVVDYFQPIRYTFLCGYYYSRQLNSTAKRHIGQPFSELTDVFFSAHFATRPFSLLLKTVQPVPPAWHVGCAWK